MTEQADAAVKPTKKADSCSAALCFTLSGHSVLEANISGRLVMPPHVEFTTLDCLISVSASITDPSALYKLDDQDFPQDPQSQLASLCTSLSSHTHPDGNAPGL